MTVVERRPGANGRSTVAYPDEWIKRHGKPPTEERALRMWLKANAMDDAVAVAEGRTLPWVDVEAAKRMLEETGGDVR